MAASHFCLLRSGWPSKLYSSIQAKLDDETSNICVVEIQIGTSPYHTSQFKQLNFIVMRHFTDEENGIMRNPSFITSSLPRQSKHKLKAGPTAAVIGGDNYIHIGETILNHIPVVAFES